MKHYANMVNLVVSSVNNRTLSGAVKTKHILTYKHNLFYPTFELILSHTDYTLISLKRIKLKHTLPTDISVWKYYKYLVTYNTGFQGCVHDIQDILCKNNTFYNLVRAE